MDQFEIKKDKSNKFLRPVNKEDVRYRKIKYMMFEKELKQVLNEDCKLCFHGTPIWNAEKIISSGKIDTDGKVYVSTINNLWFTVQHHADLLNFKYPAGCIFVIEPRDESEIKSSQEKNIISKIDFKQNPERLKAIITTPENIKRVKNWINENELNIESDLVVDYDKFLVFVKQFVERIDFEI